MRPVTLRLLILLWGLPALAAAQTPPAPPTRPAAPMAASPIPAPPAAAAPIVAPPTGVAPDESAVVQQLEVIGRRPGPALWRVTRGASEVVILGGLSPLPHQLQWNDLRVQRALQGARVLFVPALRPQFSLLDLIAFPFRQKVLRPPRGEMEGMLTPELDARFRRVAAAQRLDPGRYRHWKPAVAGLLMLADVDRATGLSRDKPVTTVVKLAHADHTPVQTVNVIKSKPWFDMAASMTDAQDQACFGAEMDELEGEAAHANAAAAAWAGGDLKTVRADMSTSLLNGCMLRLPGGQSFIEQNTRDAVRIIDHALSQPGRSVAVIDLSVLLRRDGVLDRLQAEGDPVALPPD